jgi:glycosyltransferase involved in cell wall biosynthesis
MHIVLLFHNIGGYHAARLRATHAACQDLDWIFTAIQVTDGTHEHPWGNLEQEITFPLKTLIPATPTTTDADCSSDSPQAATTLQQLLDQLQPNLLVIPGWGFLVSRAALKWGRKHNVPAILMSESKWDDEPRQWWKEVLKSLLYVKKFDAALVGSESHRDYLVKLGLSKERVFLGYDAVDNHYFEQQSALARQDLLGGRQRQPSIPEKPYFLAATRFIPRKNVLRLISAYADYRRQVGETAWDLVICGSGKEESAVRKLITQLAIAPYVHLPGFITYQNMGAWYGLAGAFVHPALQEQWGLVINEACASGLPILCSETVGARELVHPDENGFLFAPQDAAAITGTLIKMHHLSPESRAAFGQRSQAIVSHYSPSAFATGLLNAIKTAI